MLRMFQAYQTMWLSVYFDLLDYGIAPSEKESARDLVDIGAPPIVESDMPEIVSAITRLLEVVPALAENPDVLKNILVVTGHGDKADSIVEDVMNSAAARPPIARKVQPAPLEEAVAQTIGRLRALRFGLADKDDGDGKEQE